MMPKLLSKFFKGQVERIFHYINCLKAIKKTLLVGRIACIQILRLTGIFGHNSCLFNDPFPHKTCDYDNALSDLMSSKLRTFIPAQVSFEEACGNLARTRMLEEEVTAWDLDMLMNLFGGLALDA
ncbi:OLC1v1029983C8 [Oldenlandia corymbosa var. corymbosa]|uniref:OLC1v1029983C8 n=1 Tax=Oldenlandia corymbosa var. corymbosa TaxID=529605 RepID=A0AAV1CI93_OLDCO|nr:OLC1v1029983C8 [Oldenlandia corymbosa var. corymbosa]